MAAQALIAVLAERWAACRGMVLGVAAVGRIALGGELLVPKAAIQSRVRRVTVGARSRDGPPVMGDLLLRPQDLCMPITSPDI